MTILEAAQRLYTYSTSNAEIIFVFNILLSTALWLLIGQERHERWKSAWRSTFSFVILGAMLFSYISWIVRNADNSRIAAQIVSGIWFLGAWLIFVSKENQVRNLTTAAWIWVAWAIGMAVGFGYYFAAISTSLAVWLLPKALDKYAKNYTKDQLKRSFKEKKKELKRIEKWKKDNKD